MFYVFHCVSFVLYFEGRNTGINIKHEYDKIATFYDINNKVFKIVTDQAANMKKAFETTKECENSDELVRFTNELLLFQKKADLKIKQDVLKQQLIHEIDQMNSKTADSENNKNRERKREDVLSDLCYDDIDDFENDITENTIDPNESCDSLNDANDLTELIDDFLFAALN